MDENGLMYADEEETVIYRIKDLREALEMSYHMAVIDLIMLQENSRPDTVYTREWLFGVTFATPEGEQEAEILVGVKKKETDLHIYEASRLKAKTFRANTRQLAKEGIPNLTLDYIEQLEQTGQAAWLLWHRVTEYLRTTPSLRLEDVAETFQEALNGFYREYRKVGFLKPDPHHSPEKN
jgi:hypothetical protein